MWRRAAIRFGAAERLGYVAERLEEALSRDNVGAAEEAAELGRRCIDALERYPAGVAVRARRRSAGTELAEAV